MVLRIFKMIATSGFLTALERTEFVFGRDSAPYPTGGAYSAPPDPLGRERDGRDRPPLSQIPRSAPGIDRPRTPFPLSCHGRTSPVGGLGNI